MAILKDETGSWCDSAGKKELPEKNCPPPRKKIRRRQKGLSRHAQGPRHSSLSRPAIATDHIRFTAASHLGMVANVMPIELRHFTAWIGIFTNQR